MSNEENTTLNLLLVTDEHIDSLWSLQNSFHAYSASESNELNFAYEVCNDLFSEDDFRLIVSRNECVILIDGNVPVGYMLVDSCSQTKGLQQYYTAIDRLVQEDFLGPETKGMVRFIEILNPQLYQEQFANVRWQMLATLIYNNKEKYKGFCFTFFTSLFNQCDNSSRLIEMQQIDSCETSIVFKNLTDQTLDVSVFDGSRRSATYEFSLSPGKQKKIKAKASVSYEYYASNRKYTTNKTESKKFKGKIEVEECKTETEEFQ